MNEAQYLDTRALAVCPVQEMPLGSLIRTTRDEDIFFIASIPNNDLGESVPIRVVVVLGGKEPLSIWKADEFDGDLAVDLGPWAIEVDPSSLSECAGSLADVGQAFVRGSESGLVCTARFGSRPFSMSFLSDGSRARIEHRTAVAFTKWRIVSMAAEGRPVLYSSGPNLG